jgi:ornithine--oxo-acid transaminase
MAMRVALATVEVLIREHLIGRADTVGAEFRQRLREALKPYEMVKEVRGQGLLCGVEFQAPRSMRLRLSFESFKAIHPGLFGQMVVMRLFQEKNLLAQICGNNFMVLKIAPPLVVSERQIESCVASIRDIVETVHFSTTFWSQALALGRRAVSL